MTGKEPVSSHMGKTPVIICSRSNKGVIFFLVLAIIVPVGLVATIPELRREPVAVIPLLAVAICIFLLLLKQIKSQPEIIISEQGISFEKKQLITWNRIDAFRTVHTPAAYRIPATDSIILTMGNTEQKFNITNMSFSYRYIAENILDYSSNPAIRYDGHHDLEGI